MEDHLTHGQTVNDYTNILTKSNVSMDVKLMITEFLALEGVIS
jgi:hypothetical protein